MMLLTELLALAREDSAGVVEADCGGPSPKPGGIR